MKKFSNLLPPNLLEKVFTKNNIYLFTQRTPLKKHVQCH